MYKLTFFVPKRQKEKVKEALFKIGVGKYKNYDTCSFEAKGTGQFRPLENSSPFIGKQNKIERVKEYKVEMICKDKLIKKAVKALKKAHPYEEPAFDVIKVKKLS